MLRADLGEEGTVRPSGHCSPESRDATPSIPRPWQVQLGRDLNAVVTGGITAGSIHGGYYLDISTSAVFRYFPFNPCFLLRYACLSSFKFPRQGSRGHFKETTREFIGREPCSFMQQGQGYRESVEDYVDLPGRLSVS